MSEIITSHVQQFCLSPLSMSSWLISREWNDNVQTWYRLSIAGCLVEYGLTSHLTHYSSFRRWWGWLWHRPGLWAQSSPRLAPQRHPQCVRCWVCAARPLITVACKCVIWNALCPYILDARLRLWVSLKHTLTCVYNQPSWAALKHHPPPG